MKKILVIGIGSRIMMDDAIGIYLVEDLKQLDTNSTTTYMLGETDVDYCIKEILNFDNIIIIDAFLSGKKTGEITAIPLNELNEDIDDSFYSMHGMHLLSSLRSMISSLNGILIGIEPYEINYSFSLSDLLQSYYPHILREVQKEIAEYINSVEE
ncbi:MAG: hydrogenase maturation protease [Clostridiaceae bacterium]|nr:hydrogenase maturation protease [Clostridiaceae bacterium]